MSDALSRQATDRANASGVGTVFMPPKSHGTYESAAKVQDGNASGKGKTVPDRKVGAA